MAFARRLEAIIRPLEIPSAELPDHNLFYFLYPSRPFVSFLFSFTHHFICAYERRCVLRASSGIPWRRLLSERFLFSLGWYARGVGRLLDCLIYIKLEPGRDENCWVRHYCHHECFLGYAVF